MKRARWLMIGVMAILFLSMNTKVVAKTIEVVFNSVIVKFNGTQVAGKGEEYTLKNGDKVPISITYKNTTYLPLEKIADIFNMSITEGKKTKTVTLNSKKADVRNCSISNYTGDKFTLSLDNIYSNVKMAYIENESGLVSSAKVKMKGSFANVTNAYDVVQGKNYKLNVMLSTGETNVYTFSCNKYITIDINASRDYFVPANPEKGFNFPYVISFKGNNYLSNYKDTIMCDTSNNQLTDNNEYMIENILQSIKRGSEYVYDMGMKGNYITVMFIFPRPWQDPNVYTHALDRDALTMTKQKSDAIGRGDMTRLDLQYLAAIKDAMEQLKANGKEVDDKVFLHGFSASSDFASRFSLLHPEIVKGIIVNAPTTMPFSEYNGVNLIFPLGISDLKAITGSDFNVEAYKKIPQFWHAGSVDHNDGTYYGDGWGNYGDMTKDNNQEGIDYRRAFGNEIAARKRLISKVLVEKGFTNIAFKEYAGKSHEFTGEMQTDALAFLDRIQ